ncbi:sortase, partial [Candidatus Saccharibacteria bacterium]|nr:sortase [Candidatus Saccharibacteria bacterium]
QKYYEHYYAGHVQKVLNEKQSTESPSVSAPTNSPETVDTLRGKIQDKVQQNAKKARKSRHFVPITAAIVVMFVFAFLQYNSVLIGTVQAYVSPGTIDPQNIVVDPTASTQVGPEPKLIIPKINVDVPVMYGVGNDHESQMAAMTKGLAHFAIPGANSVPGQVGNTAIAGHSSNDIFTPGDYKFVFAQLEKLEPGDTVYANYQSVRYTYTVTKKEFVAPSEVSKLTYPTDKPMLTLITCWPLGTANKRILISAEQVSPDPAKAAPSAAAGSGDASMPGNSATALERLFGR